MTTTDPWLLLVLLIGWHFVADYGLQTSYIAEYKTKSWLVLLAHSSIHGFGVGVLTGYAFLAILATALHALTDGLALRSKNQDQSLHLIGVVLLWTLAALKNTV